MNSVWLIYADDYGGTFSPYFLEAVYAEDKHDEAVAHAKRLGWLGRLIQHNYKGTLDMSAYPNSHGGMFSDD